MINVLFVGVEKISSLQTMDIADSRSIAISGPSTIFT
jgi:hypothetical protein